mmetsp:Transcript_16329/g.55102  ORF Transcript_16329/g.55102 Transcript_16329/m.55102 type:complete len:219 (+) Transcript_16329:925-1581(+)
MASRMAGIPPAAHIGYVESQTRDHPCCLGSHLECHGPHGIAWIFMIQYPTRLIGLPGVWEPRPGSRTTTCSARTTRCTATRWCRRTLRPPVALAWARGSRNNGIYGRVENCTRTARRAWRASASPGASAWKRGRRTLRRCFTFEMRTAIKMFQLATSRTMARSWARGSATSGTATLWASWRTTASSSSKAPASSGASTGAKGRWRCDDRRTRAADSRA